MCVCALLSFLIPRNYGLVLLESKLPCLWFGSSVLLPLTHSLSPDIKKLVPSFKKRNSYQKVKLLCLSMQRSKLWITPVHVSQELSTVWNNYNNKDLTSSCRVNSGRKSRYRHDVVKRNLQSQKVQNNSYLSSLNYVCK